MSKSWHSALHTSLIAFALVTVFSLLSIVGRAVASETAIQLAQAAAAETKVPAKYALKLACETTGCTAVYTGNLSMEKMLPDGTVSGKVTYTGGRCGATNADYVARIAGDKFSLPMPLEPAVLCKDIVFEFTKKDGGRYEGTYNTAGFSGRPITFKLTLDPQ